MPNMSLSCVTFCLSCAKIWQQHKITLCRDVNEMIKYEPLLFGFGTVLDRWIFLLKTTRIQTFLLETTTLDKISLNTIWFYSDHISHTMPWDFAHFQRVWGQRKDKQQLGEHRICVHLYKSRMTMKFLPSKSHFLTWMTEIRNVLGTI